MPLVNNQSDPWVKGRIRGAKAPVLPTTYAGPRESKVTVPMKNLTNLLKLYTTLKRAIPFTLTFKDREGQTQVHHAARESRLSQLNPRLLTQSKLVAKDNEGTTALQIAATWGCLDQIPKSLLTKENLLTRGKHNVTALHYAALEGNLHQIPEELLTIETLTAKSAADETPLHFAAFKGNLDQIPQHIWTNNLILEPSTKGETILHVAATRGWLDQIPSKIAHDNLLLTNQVTGRSVLFDAVAAGCLHQIPLQYINEEILFATCRIRPTFTGLFGVGQYRTEWEDSSIWEQAVKQNHTDKLLGIDVSEKHRNIVGEEWWNKNLQITRGIKNLNTQEETPAIDIF